MKGFKKQIELAHMIRRIVLRGVKFVVNWLNRRWISVNQLIVGLLASAHLSSGYYLQAFIILIGGFIYFWLTEELIKKLKDE